MAVLPDFEAARFEPGTPIDNPFFPLPVGTVFSYGGTQVDDETGEAVVERNDLFVTSETKEIEGVTTTVVRDTAYADGLLVEDTLDWFAQDTEGNAWYLGELTYAFEYDDDGNFVGTSTKGSWTAGVDGAQAGTIMAVEPGFGAAYYQEFAPGVAEDEAIVAGVDEEVAIKLGEFDGVLQTLDTTALEPDIAEYKYYAPGVGLVLEEALDAEGDVESTNALLSVRAVGTDVERGGGGSNGLTLADLIEREPPAVEEPEANDFPGDAAELNVTFLGGEADLSNALGAYTFNTQTGEIGEGRILFTDTADLAEGTTASVKVAEGEGLRLFLVPRGPELGLDLSDYEDGGLFFTNFPTGEAATLSDGLAPLVTDEAGDLLPVTALHVLDTDSADGFNFLNPAAGVHATDADTTVDEEAEVLGFEELLTTDPTFDGDYDDVLVAVSEAPLGAPADALLL